jgi:hypothetical protein
MIAKSPEEPETLETDRAVVRLMNEHDLEAVVKIDAAASGRRRPRYFELMLERAVKQAELQVSLAAEVDGHVVGFAIVSLYYGEYGVTEPTASAGCHQREPGKPRPARRQRLAAAVAAESISAPGNDTAHRSIVGRF